MPSYRTFPTLIGGAHHGQPVPQVPDGRPIVEYPDNRPGGQMYIPRSTYIRDKIVMRGSEVVLEVWRSDRLSQREATGIVWDLLLTGVGAKHGE